MNTLLRSLTIALPLVVLGGCSSSSDDTPANGGPVTPDDTSNPGTTTGTDGGTDAGAGSTAGSGSTDGPGTTDDGQSTAGDGSSGGVDGVTTAGNVPGDGTSALVDDGAPAPSAVDRTSDPFASLLDNEVEPPLAPGQPSRPLNLRLDLVSNTWAEFSWAPSTDEGGEVVAYNIYRSDGHVYVMGRDQTDPAVGSQREIDKYWGTTSFMDCNYTRFADRLHDCAVNGPSPGDVYSYQVAAVDDEGNVSPRSNIITIAYPGEQGAPVPGNIQDDEPYYQDDFAYTNDLSNTAGFLDQFTLIFEDEFDGSTIDSRYWNTELVWGDTRIINGEQQYFVDTQNDSGFSHDPFRFTGESLVISAVPASEADQALFPPACFEDDPTGNQHCQFLSGSLASHDKVGFTYGYVEARMKVGGTPGALSSFYLYNRYAGTNSATARNYHAPEIDIIEYLGENPFGDEDAFQTYHFGDTNTEITRSAPTMSYKNPTGERFDADFHTYSVLWEPQLVIWYIDGQEIARMTGQQVARQQMNIVAYLVAGSEWAPTPASFPLELEIDYIRAYQRGSYVDNSIRPPLD